MLTELDRRVAPWWIPTPRYPLIVIALSVIATYDGKRITIAHRHRKAHRKPC